MLNKVGLNYIANETAEFLSIGIFRMLAYGEVTEPLPLGLLKKGKITDSANIF